MGRPKKIKTTDKIDEIIARTPKNELSDMPLNSLEDYQEYNRMARAFNKKLGLCRYKIKQCPIDLHPKQRVIFNRNDQPHNNLPVYLSNEMIEYKETLVPGKTYDLPVCVAEYLAEKGVPVWKWFDNPDGSKETRKASTTPRFSLRSVF